MGLSKPFSFYISLVRDVMNRGGSDTVLWQNNINSNVFHKMKFCHFANFSPKKVFRGFLLEKMVGKKHPLTPMHLMQEGIKQINWNVCDQKEK